MAKYTLAPPGTTMIQMLGLASPVKTATSPKNRRLIAANRFAVESLMFIPQNLTLLCRAF
jgi:hypothetical protein